VIPASATQTTTLLRQELLPLVDRFRALQDPSGRVAGDPVLAGELLARLRPRGRQVLARVGAAPGQAAAFEADFDQWLTRGLDTPPQFDATLAAYEPPSDGALTFFIAPFSAPNGPAPRGRFLECFLAYREEPADLAQLAVALPHPKNKCQSTRLLAASAGLRTGNCVVFFPENVAVATPVREQTFAIFFFNKFYRIYFSETLPRTQRLLEKHAFASAALSAEECYRARCIWGYLHDYYHHQGPKPIDTNLAVKLNFFVGLLEEIKVDCQSVLATRQLAVPFWRELVEFILFERLFRYPCQPDATSNFDAGTGVFLFEWLRRSGHGLVPTATGLRLDLDGCLESMAALVRTIEGIESVARDDAEYKRLATELVRTMLPKGEPGTRFDWPGDYPRIAIVQRDESPVLEFDDLPY
jgi:hypothetical protein